MTSLTVRRAAAVAALTLAATATFAACTGTSGAGNRQSDEQIAAACPSSPIATTIGIDGTGSYQSKKAKAENLRIISGFVRRTAICGGHLRVFGFASSTGGTVPLFEGDLQADAPTDNAKLRKAGKLADQTLQTITDQYDPAFANLAGSGSDILGMLTLLQQANAQYPDHTPVDLLLTDGLTNIGADPTTVTTPDAATSLADAQRAPDLTGAEVSVIGIGREASGEIPSAVIENVTVFWQRICENTHAASCQISTEGK